jgi:hypothetical protein
MSGGPERSQDVPAREALLVQAPAGLSQSPSLDRIGEEAPDDRRELPGIPHV